MTDYYVKNGGDGSHAGSYDPTSDSWASAHDNIAAAVTAGAVAGDRILCSDAHSYAGSTRSISAGVRGNPLVIISVDDSDGVTYSPGALESSLSGGHDFTFNGCASVYGLIIHVDDSCFTVFTANQQHQFYDCEFRAASSGFNFSVLSEGSTAILYNCTFTLDYATGTTIQVGTGSTLRMFGGAITSTAGITSGPFNLGLKGSVLEVVGVDLSGITGYLLGSFSTNDDAIEANFIDCKMHASAGYFSSYFTKENMIANFIRCSSSSSAAEYSYVILRYAGFAQDDTSKYRNETTVFPDSGQEVSLKVNTATAAVASKYEPFEIPFPARYAELSSASTDTIRLYLTCDDTLTDLDVFAVAFYPDGTNKQTPNSAFSHSGSYLHDPMRTGTTLSTDGTSTWTNGLTNKYYIDVDTSGDVGADCFPEIRLFVTKQTTIYFDTTVDIVA